MRYLGLDLGSRTLGMALSDATGFIASNYKTIRHNEEYDELIEAIKEVVKEKDVEAIVLGYPKNMNNTLGPRALITTEFGEKIQNTLNIPVYYEDERLTTRQAETMLIQNDTSRKKRKKVIDSIAAVIILQSYLDKKGKKL